MIFTLIGMPGSGKSCLGRAISSKPKMRVIDTDKYIERRYGKKLCEIVSEQGEEQFKITEAECLKSIEEDNVIISTGGSAVYYDDAMKYLKSRGKVIYLYVGLDLIKKRLGDYSKRGIVMKEGQTIDDLYRERCSLYEKYADFTVNCNGTAYPKYQAQVITAIRDWLK